jgi:hypothetical protein
MTQTQQSIQDMKQLTDNLISMTVDAEGPFCLLCDQLGGTKGHYKTDHESGDCRRCESCKRWQKDGNLEAHTAACRDGKIQQGSRKKAPRLQKKALLCKFFHQYKHCRNGDMCSFRHEDEFLSARNAAGNITCNHCKEFGHHMKDCPDGCRKCGNPDHFTFKCIKCFNCEKWGHHKKDCDQCEECGERHNTNKCPHMWHK